MLGFQPQTRRTGGATFTLAADARAPFALGADANGDLLSEAGGSPAPTKSPRRRRILNIEGDHVTQLSPESPSLQPRSGRGPSPRAPFAYEHTYFAPMFKEMRF